MNQFVENKTQSTYQFWHALSHPNEWRTQQPLRIVKGDGLYVWDDKGHKMLDGFAGLWCVNVGHNRTEVKDAIKKQMDEISYYQLFAGVSHPLAEQLSNKLIAMTAQEDMANVVYGSGGSDAVETAIKIARQYWVLQGQPQRTRIISLKNAYHGVNIGGTSLNGMPVFKMNYGPLLEQCIQIESPWLYRNPWNCEDPDQLAQLVIDELERTIQYHGVDSIAAFIAEPIQGAGGIIVPPDAFWPSLRKLCDKYDILLIADEVITGFGRSGSMFGSRGWGVKPDMMTLAKGLSSGYVPLSATIFNHRIAKAFYDNNDHKGLFMHGYTYGGHPLGCAAALAVLDIVEKENLPENAAQMGRYLLTELQKIKEQYALIGEVRGKGLMLALDLVKDQKTREPIDADSDIASRLTEACRDAGAVIRPIGTKLCLAPPLTIDQAGCDVLINALKSAFKQVTA